MRNFYSLRKLCLLAVLFLLAACSGPEPTAIPRPAATPIPATATSAPPTDTAVPPTATPEPSATATTEPTATPVWDASLPADWVTFTDETQGLVIHHPAQWDVTQPTAQALAELLAKADGSGASESIQAILRQLTDTPGALERFAALGFLFDDPTVADNQFVSNFTGIVVPADGLTLDTYVKLVSAQMGNVENLAVQSAQVESGLRPGGLDVASLRYTMDGATLYGLADGTQIDGWQVALYDTDADQLLILSLTGISDNFPALEEMFRTLIYHLEFE
jgi:hypothetical protein